MNLRHTTQGGECTAIKPHLLRFYIIHVPAAAFHCTRTGSRESCILASPGKHLQHREGLPALRVRLDVLRPGASDAVACEAVSRIRDGVRAVPKQLQLPPEVIALKFPCRELSPRQRSPLSPPIPCESDDLVQIFTNL